MTHHLAFLSQRRFGSLDGLRAASILAVIWHHTLPSKLSGSLVHIGAEGVTLFFAISGFLITTLLLRERDRNGAIDLKAFYLRRTLRIFPLYYGTLLIYVVVVAILERNTDTGKAFFSNLPYFFTYMSNLFVPLDGRVIFYFAWSLATEEQFYLVWPPILMLLGTTKRAFVPLCLAIAAYSLAELMGSNVLSAISPAIVIGALLGVALHNPSSFQLLYKILGHEYSSLVIAIILAIALIGGSTPNTVLHIFFVALVGSCVIREHHFFSKFLSIQFIAYFGSISYGMYMLHMLSKNLVLKLLHVFKLPSDGYEVFLLTFFIAAFVASLSYRYYESYFIKLKIAHER